jgi:nucleotide-binding universal stress UspA family protein
MVPWIWGKIDVPDKPDGVVVFGAGHSGTVAALARLATIVANFYNAFPLAARIVPIREKYTSAQRDSENTLMGVAQTEVSTMGSELYSMWRESDDIAEGILEVARQSNTRAIVLGLTWQADPVNFQRIIGGVVEQAGCSTVVVKFNGIFHSERILVPIVNMRELYVVRDIIKAFLLLGQQRFTFVRLIPSYERNTAIAKAEKRLARWIEMEGFVNVATCKALPTESRQETILLEAQEHDLVVMVGSLAQGFGRFLFGSLASKVAQKCSKTLITVYPASL